MRWIIPVALLLISWLLAACDGGDDAEPSPTAGDAESSATATPGGSEATAIPSVAPTDTPPLEPSVTPTASAGSEGEIGPGVIWDASVLFPRLQDACPGTIEPSCLVESAREEGAPEPVIDFYETYDVFLYDFEEIGVVDFGAVNSPLLNMGRPLPVFLNGDFGLLYVNEVVPEDWKAQPTYNDPAMDDFLWTEYSQMTGSTESASGQTFGVSVPIGGCRACQRDGHLNLSVSFDTAGALRSVEVEPMTEEEGRG